MLANDRHPLTAEAAEAAGLSEDSELLGPLARLVRSRNRQIAASAITALHRQLSNVRSSTHGLTSVDRNPAPGAALADAASKLSDEQREKIAEEIGEIVADSYVDADLRQEGLAVVRLFGGDPYRNLLEALADQAELEGTPLLNTVAAELRERSRDENR
jgi:hypothetical protein